MVHLQIVSRDGLNLQSELRAAIAEERIKSFELAQVKGGVRLRHKRYLGEIKLEQTAGPLIVTVICKNRSKEWQLLSAFIGRLADHFKDQISSINIQLEPNDAAPRKPAARKPARKKR